MSSSDVSNSMDHQVLIEEHKSVRILVLNRPKQLNALSEHMVSRLLELFLAYEEDPRVKLIILKGNGRAFCAGGDVPTVTQNFRKDWRLGANFFGKQYSLDYVMATYRKPQVSILNGFVMGGGAGVSIHGRFRVVTENTVFAMPEVAIGSFPDVGASYFLSRLPGFFGEYLGLTGARLDGAEMLACGLATHFVPSAKLPLLEEELCKTAPTDPVNISKIIYKYEEQPALKENSAYLQLRTIDKCFSCETIEDILSSLVSCCKQSIINMRHSEIAAAERKDYWISVAIQSLKKGSPISLKITLRSIREGRLQGVDQCIAREYRMICHAIRAEISGDIFEGCRATFIDKDKNPKWEPSRLELVSDSMVDHYFSRVDDKEWQDLKFPVSSKVPLSRL